MRPLHELNPARLQYIKNHCELQNTEVLDIGCGAGLISEALAEQKAIVTAVDANADVIQIAKDHAELSNLKINYLCNSIEEFAAATPKKFPVIICMELLEHVDDPKQFLQILTTLLADDGKLFLSTVNRNLKSYVASIIGAEYIFKLLPKGTHDYHKYITPAELAHFCRQANCRLQHLQGINYNPLLGQSKLTNNVDINYLAIATRNTNAN